MNAARLRRIEEQQTGIARKVLAAVPIAEFWTDAQVVAELFRQGMRADPSIVSGCLADLYGQGLVKRAGNSFQRVDIPDEDPAPTKVAAIGLASPAQPKPSGDVLEQLGAIGARLRERAAQLSALADDLDAAALEAAEQIARAGEGGEQLRKLRAMLKGLVE